MDEPAMKEDDIVQRIMESHKNMMAKGGVVANGGDDDLDRMADGDPNNFDDLALDDHLEPSFEGKPGNEVGDDAESEDRSDIVSRVHKSWKKKDRNPRPA